MTENSYDLTIAEAVEEYLKTEKLRYGFVGDLGAFHFYHAVPGPMNGYAWSVVVDRRGFTIVVLFPVGMDIRNRDQVIRMNDFQIEVNRARKYGRMDFREDGTASLIIHCPCYPQILQGEQLKAVVRQAMEEGILLAKIQCFRLAPRILDVLFRGVDGTTAAKEVSRGFRRNHREEEEEEKEQLSVFDLEDWDEEEEES